MLIRFKKRDLLPTWLYKTKHCLLMVPIRQLLLGQGQYCSLSERLSSATEIDTTNIHIQWVCRCYHKVATELNYPTSFYNDRPKPLQRDKFPTSSHAQASFPKFQGQACSYTLHTGWPHAKYPMSWHSEIAARNLRRRSSSAHIELHIKSKKYRPAHRVCRRDINNTCRMLPQK